MTTRADIANESNRKLYQNHLASMAKLRDARLRIEELENALQMIWDAYPFKEEEDAELGEIVISALEKRHAK